MKKYLLHFLALVICIVNVQIAASAEQAYDTEQLPSFTTFQDVLHIDDITAIQYGVIVNSITKKCADIDYEDLRKWLDTYWNFHYDRVIAPMEAFSLDGEYIKLWNEDKSQAFIVYPGGGIIAGKYGEPYELNGVVKQNYVWYLPYIGNARNALNTANGTLKYTYITQVNEMEFKAQNQREFTKDDDIEIPQADLLITHNASSWAVDEIKKAAACNLMVYDLSAKYTQPITRYEFCRLVYRLIATEFEPNTDSRLGIEMTIRDVLSQRGITDRVTFSDCSYLEVEYLASMDIIQGMGDGTFAPDAYITREQAAALLYRTAAFLGNKTLVAPTNNGIYDDQAFISNWALDAVASMKAMGIMQGVSETEFAPQDTYTTEQAIATMLRLYECN